MSDEAPPPEEPSVTDETDAGWAAPGTPPVPPPSPSPSGAWTPPASPPAAAGWSAPTMAPAPPRGRKRRKLWPWMLGLVLIATIGSGAVGGTVFVTKMLPVVIDVDDFMSEVQLSSTSAAPDRHAAAAYNHLCAADRNGLEDFKSSILASDEFTNISSYSVHPFPDVNGNTATIDVEITYNDGTTKAYSFDVVKENGDWQLCSNSRG